MLHRPLAVEPECERALENALHDLQDRLHRRVTELLEVIDEPEIRRQVRYVAFEASDALPKRRTRPTVIVHHVVEQFYRGYASDTDRLGDLLSTSVAAMEYYDIVDDVIDGDVAAGHEVEVVVTNELLMPLFVRALGRLGQEAVEYWTDQSLRTVGSFVMELSSEPSAENYRELLDRQAHLFGSVTGLAAVAAGAVEEDVERAAAAGRAYFRYDQILLDFRQFVQDDDDPWNAWTLLDEESTRSYLDRQRSTFERHVETLPEEHRRLLTPLVAVDVDEFRLSLT